MSVRYIPDGVKYQLWAKSAGRCNYCNTPLWFDDHTKSEFNTAYIAHIIADSPNGPRGDAILSEKLKADIANLMLMCDEHHRLIDKKDVEGHTIERLQKMKNDHEDRIHRLTSIAPEKHSHILLYGSNIGAHTANLNWTQAANAIVPQRYPAEKNAIELGLTNSVTRDNEIEFWQVEKKNLEGKFNQYVRPRLESGEIAHLSVFALAPQPLLIYLGKLLSDIPQAEIYQLHREPPTWNWQDMPSENLQYTVLPTKAAGKIVGLNLSLSATINESRITSVLGGNAPIWTVTIDRPHNDFLQHPDQLSNFRTEFRNVLNQIKSRHGQDAEIHLFPAVPVSIAVDIGRVWMPKADLPLVVYDQNQGGFSKALDIR